MLERTLGDGSPRLARIGQGPPATLRPGDQGRWTEEIVCARRRERATGTNRPGWLPHARPLCACRLAFRGRTWTLRDDLHPPPRGHGKPILSLLQGCGRKTRRSVPHFAPATPALPVLHIAYSSSYMHTPSHSTCMYVMKLREQGWGAGGRTRPLTCRQLGVLIPCCMASCSRGLSWCPCPASAAEGEGNTPNNAHQDLGERNGNY